jgi:methyl-accepting chemotaxis protein
MSDSDIGIPGLTLPPWSLPKAPDFRKKIVDQVKAIFSPAIKAALDVNVDIGIKKEVVALISQIFDKLKTLLGDIAFVANELLSKTETLGKNLIDKISDELSSLVEEVQRAINNVLAGVRDNLINPFFEKINELRRTLVEDIRNLIDKILSGLQDLADKILKEGDRILTGTIDEFKAEIEKVVKFIPNPLDPCRIKYDLQFTLGNDLTIGDLYNLFECTMLGRLEIDDTVREIKTIYGDLQHRSWHLSCVARGTIPGVSGSSGLQDIAIKSWIKYGQLFQLWNQFEDDMTPLTALEIRIKQLEDEIDSFRSKSAQIDDLSTEVQKVQKTASDASLLANQVNDRTTNITCDGTNTVIKIGTHNTLVIQDNADLVMYGEYKYDVENNKNISPVLWSILDLAKK